MVATEKYALGSATTLLSTELNSLANNANAVTPAAFNNTQGGGAGDGYTLAALELVCSYGTAPTASTGVSVWFLQTVDGANYEDGGSSVTPARAPDCVLPLRGVTGAQRVIRRVILPGGNFHALLRNDGTGQAMAASGNALKLRPATHQGA